jgi:hypothetical protein
LIAGSRPKKTDSSLPALRFGMTKGSIRRLNGIFASSG